MPAASKTHFVLIPSYNPGPKVLATVQAARAQWTPVWVVVDGSTDGSTEKLQALATSDAGLKVIVLPDGSHGHPMPAATIDNTMIKSIARAFRWQRLLEIGTYTCLDDIARSEKIGPSFVSRYHRLVLLAPDIVEGILFGERSEGLTLGDLMVPLPMGWEEQRERLGFPAKE